MSREIAKTQIALLDLAEGFFESRILFALESLGVFGCLGDRTRPVGEIAEALDARPDTLVRLLNAGVALHLLESDDGEHFRVHPRWAPVLLPSAGEAYMGNWVRYLDFLSGCLRKLADAAKHGGPVVDLLDTKDEHDLREFTLAMHNYAALRGQELAHFLDLKGCKTLLDLGCGPGTYAFLLGQHHPELELHLLDLPEILVIAKELQGRYALGNPVRYLPVDVTKEEIEGTYDVVLVSNTLHMLGEQESRRLLKRLHRNVAPGGSLVVQAQFLDEDRLGGRWPILVDLVQLCITTTGRNHTVAETRRWMEEAGFGKLLYSPMSVMNTNGFIRGYRTG